MKLVGMLTSPYTRRVAISLSELGVEFEHVPVSVFSDYAEFRAFNPVVRAPTLLLDDGTADSGMKPPPIPRNSRPGFRTDPAQRSD